MAAARRARIVLLAGEGLGPSAIADKLRCSRQTVLTWRERYRSGGLVGLRDAPRSGRPPTVDAAAVVRRTLESPEPVTARWSSRTLAAEFGISNVAVAHVWRAWGIAPSAGGRVRLATEPALESPLSAVAGLYLGPRLQLLAVLVGGSAGTDQGMRAVPVECRPGLGSLLAGIDTGKAGDGDADVFVRFLKGLTGIETSDRLAVIADGPDEEMQRWVESSEMVRSGVVLHYVPPGVSWGRLARVACLLAGASPAGAASVLDLCDAVTQHPAGRQFSWVSHHCKLYAGKVINDVSET